MRSSCFQWQFWPSSMSCRWMWTCTLCSLERACSTMLWLWFCPRKCHCDRLPKCRRCFVVKCSVLISPGRLRLASLLIPAVGAVMLSVVSSLLLLHAGSVVTFCRIVSYNSRQDGPSAVKSPYQETLISLPNGFLNTRVTMSGFCSAFPYKHCHLVQWFSTGGPTSLFLSSISAHLNLFKQYNKCASKMWANQNCSPPSVVNMLLFTSTSMILTVCVCVNVVS